MANEKDPEAAKRAVEEDNKKLREGLEEAEKRAEAAKNKKK